MSLLELPTSGAGQLKSLWKTGLKYSGRGRLRGPGPKGEAAPHPDTLKPGEIRASGVFRFTLLLLFFLWPNVSWPEELRKQEGISHAFKAGQWWHTPLEEETQAPNQERREGCLLFIKFTVVSTHTPSPLQAQGHSWLGMHLGGLPGQRDPSPSDVALLTRSQHSPAGPARPGWVNFQMGWPAKKWRNRCLPIWGSGVKAEPQTTPVGVGSESLWTKWPDPNSSLGS